MKKNVFITIVIILLLTGAISYLIIWWRNKKNAATGSETNDQTKPNQSTTGTIINTGPLVPTSTIPSSYTWWENKLGHASFPLGMGSKGVEVVKVQEVLNKKAKEKTSWGLSPIAVDGIWGNETNTRFKLFYPGYNLVTQYMFITEFDPAGEILY